jgi:hypothetical protein
LVRALEGKYAATRLAQLAIHVLAFRQRVVHPYQVPNQKQTAKAPQERQERGGEPAEDHVFTRSGGRRT